MSRVVFDIETLGFPLESFDETRQDYLMKFASTDEEKAEAVLKMNLSPLTAQILAIGMIDPDRMRGGVFFQGPGLAPWQSEDGSIKFLPTDEKGILEEFWQAVSRYKTVVTFNGRSFDGPFIMLRSAMLGVKTRRNLVPNRYRPEDHCDLLDQLTFYGATRKFNLDFYCKAFGIQSPKEEGITGLDMGNLFHAGKYREIAEYCIRDVRATAELFLKWEKYLGGGAAT